MFFAKFVSWTLIAVFGFMRELQTKKGKEVQTKKGKELQTKKGKEPQTKKGKELQTKKGEGTPEYNSTCTNRLSIPPHRYTCWQLLLL